MKTSTPTKRRQHLDKLIADATLAKLSGIVDLNHIDVSGITDFSQLFRSYGVGTNTIIGYDITDWDLSSGTKFTAMFQSVVVDMDTSKWDTSSATDMSFMFNKCKLPYNFKPKTLETNLVSNMAGMFCDTYGVNFDPSGMDLTSNTTTSSMFMGCTGMKTDLSQWDVSNLTSTSYMFCSCDMTDITGLDNWNISTTTDTANMFSCTKYYGDIYVNDYTSTFTGCSGYTNDIRRKLVLESI